MYFYTIKKISKKFNISPVNCFYYPWTCVYDEFMSLRLQQTLKFCVIAALASCQSAWKTTLLMPPPPTAIAVSNDTIHAAILKAGDNQWQIERFLNDAAKSHDDEKLAAARWLVANMPGQGFARYELVTKDMKPIPFDAVACENLAAAQALVAKLEKEHGELDFKVTKFVEDLSVIEAEFLTTNLELSLSAWRTNPWCKNISFQTYCERILPYRGTNEPLSSWRGDVLARLEPLREHWLSENSPPQTVGQSAMSAATAWVAFKDIYYMHPQDQSWSEMCQSKAGRCEDISNVTTYALHAAGVPAASDYVPAWADRDNNHTWDVLLDGDGKGSAGLFNRTLKVYRKNFSPQPDALGSTRAKSEPAAPGWLRGDTYSDVTDQYGDTVELDRTLEPAPEGHRFAYLCVFNGGDWTPLAWSQVDAASNARFTKLRTNVLALPAYFVDGKVKPAGPPVLVRDKSEHSWLDGMAVNEPAEKKEIEIEIAAVRPDTPDHDTLITRPRLPVKAGAEYTLRSWCQGAWKEVGKAAAPEDGSAVAFAHVPANQLLWLTTPDGNNLERPFTIENGKQVFW